MHRWIIGVCVFYIASIALYYGFIETIFIPRDLELYLNSSHTLIIKVDSYPDISENGLKFIAKILELDNHTELKSRLLVRIQKGQVNHERGRSAIEYGDVFKINGAIKQPESFIGDTGRTFNYPAYLATDGIYGIINPTQITWIYNDGNIFIRTLYKWRTWFVDRLNEYFKGDEHGLLTGMLIGEKSRLSNELAEYFRVVGLSHIVVLSGYNITLVVSAIMYIAQWIGFGYRGRRVIASIVVPPFVIMTGAGASSVRAGAMSVIQLLLQVDTRIIRSYVVVLYTLVYMVVSSPMALVYSPSLHLSFLAFIGLIYIAPILRSVTWVKNIIKKCESYAIAHMVSNLIVETISVQIFVLPYIIYMSGTFSMISLLVNIIVVPLAPWIMLGGFIVVTVSIINSFFAELVALPIVWLLRYIITVSKWGASLDSIQLAFSHISVKVVAGIYLVAGLLIMWWFSHKNKRNVISVTIESSS